MRISLCHLKSNDKVFKKMLKSVLARESSQYLNLWRRKLFTGRGYPPRQLKSNEGVFDCVKRNNSTLGIASSMPNEKSF